MQYHASATSDHVDVEGRLLVSDKREEPAAHRSSDFKAVHELTGHHLPKRCPLAISLLVNCVSRCSRASRSGCISLSNISFGDAKAIAVLKLPCIMLQLASSSENADYTFLLVPSSPTTRGEAQEKAKAVTERRVSLQSKPAKEPAEKPKKATSRA